MPVCLLGWPQEKRPGHSINVQQHLPVSLAPEKSRTELSTGQLLCLEQSKCSKCGECLDKLNGIQRGFQQRNTVVSAVVQWLYSRQRTVRTVWPPFGEHCPEGWQCRWTTAGLSKLSLNGEESGQGQGARGSRPGRGQHQRLWHCQYLILLPSLDLPSQVHPDLESSEVSPSPCSCLLSPHCVHQIAAAVCLCRNLSCSFFFAPKIVINIVSQKNHISTARVTHACSHLGARIVSGALAEAMPGWNTAPYNPQDPVWGWPEPL